MDDTVLGIDVAKLKLDIALRCGEKFKTKVFANTERGFADLQTWLTKQGVNCVHACLEATGSYGEAVATFLADAGHTVSIVNPAQIKAFARSQLARNKTDQADARLIALFCSHFHPARWIPAPAQVRELRALVQRLEALLAMHTQEHNRLESASQTVVADIRAHLVYLDEQIVAVRQRIKDHIDRHPDLKNKSELLRSIPGIGPATLASILAYMPDVSLFTSPKQVAAWIGLNPRQHQSGSSVRGRTFLAKTGHATLRKALYMPALVACRYNPILKAFYERLVAAGKNRKAAVCAVMRKLVHMIFGVLKHQQPFNPNWQAC